MLQASWFSFVSFNVKHLQQERQKKGLVVCSDPVQHNSPLHAYVDLKSLIFISEGHFLLGICTFLFRVSNVMGKDCRVFY